MSTIIYLLITMAFSAFFSGMEIAFVSVDKLRFEMERKPGITSSILSCFFRNPNNFISTMLVGNNIALVIYGILMAQIIEVNLLAGMIDNHFVMVLVQTIISTLVILVTGEFLPKTLFKINPNLVLRVFAIPLFVCYVILFPISKFASGLSYLFLRLFGMRINKEASDKAFGKVDLDYFVQSGIENAANEEELDAEVKIFQNALDFSNIKIRDCIVPRTEVVAVDVTASLEDLKNVFVESGISKIIVYDGNIDNVIGYIHSSEMFRNPADWRNNVKEVPIVPETMAAHKLMKLFMQQKKTIAVVVDEFGGTSGIVSLEDLVEEIFGDIEDEHDNTSYICKQIGEHEYVLSARLEIEKVNETTFALIGKKAGETVITVTDQAGETATISVRVNEANRVANLGSNNYFSVPFRIGGTVDRSMSALNSLTYEVRFRIDTKNGSDHARINTLLGVEKICLLRVDIHKNGSDNEKRYLQLAADDKGGIRFEGKTEIQTGVWYNAAVVIDESKSGTDRIALYLDGKKEELQLTQGSTSDLRNINLTNNFFIGRSDNKRPLNGAISYARIWTKALSDTEIADQQNEIFTDNRSGLVANWLFNNGNGTTQTFVSLTEQGFEAIGGYAVTSWTEDPILQAGQE